ncbi:hypothetical protein GF407_16050 [candidate division KSB1 bacterium]|nr:hypothetical protein [candidate division KSB1 bacterium]
MKISIPPLILEEYEGFTNDNDLFGYKLFAEKFTNLIKQADESLVIGLTGGWGTGKTTFVKMWRGMLRNEFKTKSIYFDAFQSDFHSDSFLALAAELYTLFDKKSEKEFKKKIKGIAKAIGFAGLEIGLKLFTPGIVDHAALKSINTDKIVNAVKDSTEILISQKVDLILEERNIIKSFQDFLRDQTEKKLGEEKLIFIIDELDRCKPTFALDLLEKIKHLFSVPKIVFVLVMNQDQMLQIIKSRYGSSDMSANSYLQKFINLWVSLPAPKIEHSSQLDQSGRYLEYCLEKMGYEKFRPDDLDMKIFLKLIRHWNMSFREIEQAVVNFAILENITSNNLNDVYKVMVIFVSILKVKFPDVFSKLLRQRVNFDDFVSMIELAEFRVFTDKVKQEEDPLLVLLVYSLANEQERKLISQKGEKYYRLNYFEHENILINVAGWLNAFSQVY